jgi:aspartyl-tRNA(Asn)/glutamyl-tRNA(Gln) amidotransferase subunit A
VCNCASKVLENYIAPYDATVISKIKTEDGVIIGMLNCDEFAAGSSGENSAFGPTENPVAPGFVPGGSSSGSAAAVAAGFCDIALGSDTGGSIRAPASHCGIVGVKPSYGLVSRHGLIDLSMSLDQIGPLATSIKDAALLLGVISGEDAKDPVTIPSSHLTLTKPKKIKLGMLKIAGVDSRIQKLVDARIVQVAKKNGWSVQNTTIAHVELAVQTYYLLVYAEFFSATRRFDGRRYGVRIEEACGKEVLRRILGGREISRAEFEGAYYQKALAVKELIAAACADTFKAVDAIVLPTCPSLPWKLGSGLNMPLSEVYASDALTIPANLAGICALSLPAGIIDKIPIGMQVLCNRGEEAKMLSIAQAFEQ